MTNKLIQSHGGYRKLKSFQMAEIVFDFTVEFVQRYISPKSRTRDQMEQAARSGTRNIGEGSQTSGTSRRSELRLVDVARASLQELLDDYIAFLRQRSLPLWDKNSAQAAAVRQLAYKLDKTYGTYRAFMDSAETAANCALCLIHQANYLLDQQLRFLAGDMEEKGVEFESQRQKMTRIFLERQKIKKQEDDWLKEMTIKINEIDKTNRTNETNRTNQSNKIDEPN